jgi:flagellin-specific chaperone FliS
MNKRTTQAIIKRQFNLIIDEEKKLREVLDMETNDEHPEALFSGLYTRAEKHLDTIVNAQNKIVLLQNIIKPD